MSIVLNMSTHEPETVCGWSINLLPLCKNCQEIQLIAWKILTQGNTSVRLIKMSNIRMNVCVVSQVVKDVGGGCLRMLPGWHSFHRIAESRVGRWHCLALYLIPDKQSPSLDTHRTENSHFQGLQILLLGISDFLNVGAIEVECPYSQPEILWVLMRSL